MTLEQAAIRCGYDPGKEGIRTLKGGKVGRESTIRGFAVGFADKICEHYGEQVRARFGKCDAEAAADWLAEKAGFRRPGAVAATSRDEDDLADRVAAKVLERLERVAPDLSRLSFGQHESPRERLDRRMGDAAKHLVPAGFTVPPLGQGSHGGKFKTNDEADAAYRMWLQAVEHFNPGKELPAEVTEDEG